MRQSTGKRSSKKKSDDDLSWEGSEDGASKHESEDVDSKASSENVESKAGSENGSQEPPERSSRRKANSNVESKSDDRPSRRGSKPKGEDAETSSKEDTGSDDGSTKRSSARRRKSEGRKQSTRKRRGVKSVSKNEGKSSDEHESSDDEPLKSNAPKKRKSRSSGGKKDAGSKKRRATSNTKDDSSEEENDHKSKIKKEEVQASKRAKVDEETKEFEVESIVDSRTWRGKTQYKIHWRGFDSKDDTWEDEDKLKCPAILKAFMEKRESEQNEEEKDEEDKGTSNTEYEVQSVVEMRTRRGKRQFRIRWKGFGSESDTWEDENLLKCPELLKKFLSKSNDAQQGAENSESKTSRTPKRESKTSRTPKRDSKKSESKASNGRIKDEADSDEEYEVEQVLSVAFVRGGKRMFQIRWKGYTENDDTWEPEEHLNCKDLIKEFMLKYKEDEGADRGRELRTGRKRTARYRHKDPRCRQSRRQASHAHLTYYESD